MVDEAHNNILRKAREGIRHTQWKTVLAGTTGVSVITLLAVSGFSPLITAIAAGALSLKDVQNWLASLGANALSSWVANWATGTGKQIVVDQTEQERRAVELERLVAAEPTVAGGLAKLLTSIDAVPESLDSLTNEVDAQTDLLLEQQKLLRRLSDDIRRIGFKNKELDQLLRDTQRTLLDLSGSVVGDVITGDMAGGNINKPNITINVWQWESFNSDELVWLMERLNQDDQERKSAEIERWKRVDWLRAAQTYRQELGRLYGSMQIFGMSRPVPLSDVFTDVYLLDTPSAWRRHNIEELQRRAELYSGTAKDDKRYEGSELVAREQRLFILGQPGAGKTTFLKHLVMEALQGSINVIPIFVSLKVWADSSRDLMYFIARQFAICSFPNAQPFIETILDEGKALVLFDGLDEVSDINDQRRRTSQAIRDFCQRYSGNRIVITCRAAATEYTFEQFSYCELADFSENQVDSFVRRWFRHSPDKIEAFFASFEKPENDRLSDLARRPLLLTMLCLTFDETMAFPQRRAELYEEAIDALLKKWDSSRSIQREQIYQKLSLGHKRQLLNELAAESFQRNELFMPKHVLVTRVVRFLRRLPPVNQHEDIDGEAVLRAIEAQHGLLIERAHGIYSFSHLTFQEFFTARYIAGHPNENARRGAIDRGANTQWREVLHLTASMLDYQSAEVFFRLWTGQLQKIIQGDYSVNSFLKWVELQTNGSNNPNVLERMSVLTIALIDQVDFRYQDLVAEMETADQHALEFSPDLAIKMALDRTLNRVHSHVRVFEDALKRARLFDFKIKEDLDLALDYVIEIKTSIDDALESANDFQTDKFFTYDHDYDLSQLLTRNLVAAYEAAGIVARAVDLAETGQG